MDVVEQISVCDRLLRGAISRAATRHHLSDGQISLLWRCRGASGGGIKQRELAATLAVSAAHVSGLVEQLRERQLLVGQRQTSDRRCQCWKVTPSGGAAIASVLLELADWAAALDGRLPAPNGKPWPDLSASYCVSSASRPAVGWPVGTSLD